MIVLWGRYLLAAPFLFVEDEKEKETMKHLLRLVIPLIVCILSTFSVYAYNYEEYIDPATGIRTFYLSFDENEVYHAYQGPVLVADAPIMETTESEPETIEEPKPIYGDIVLSEEDANALRWILCLEEEGFEEECRICEVIFNRVLSEKNWGNTVGEVLAKKGQFSTYKYIGSSKAWDTPGEVEDDVISEVLRETSTRLPSLSYVYFDSKGGKNGKDHVKYKGTTYGRE